MNLRLNWTCTLFLGKRKMSRSKKNVCVKQQRAVYALLSYTKKSKTVDKSFNVAWNAHKKETEGNWKQLHAEEPVECECWSQDEFFHYFVLVITIYYIIIRIYLFIIILTLTINKEVIISNKKKGINRTKIYTLSCIFWNIPDLWDENKFNFLRNIKIFP